MENHIFNRARSFSVAALENVIDFLEQIHTRSNNQNLLNFIVELQTFNEKLKSATSPFLEKTEISKFVDAAVIFILNANNTVTKQLTLYWNAHKEIDRESSRLSKNYQPLKYVESDLQRLKDAHKDFVDTIKRIQTPKIDIDQIKGIMLEFNNKMQTMGFAMEKQFVEILNEFNLSQKYDVTEIFSVNKKIKRNTTFETDALAVRDAISHYKYKLSQVGDSWEIQFSNNEKGWNFNEKFSRNEFIKFLHDCDFLYRAQITLIMLLLAGNFLLKYLVKL